MQLEKVSLVGADFEIGQTHKGLVHSSDLLLNYLQKFKQTNFELIKQIKSPQVGGPVHCFSDLDLFRIDIKKYEDLCIASQMGIQKNKTCVNFGGDHSIAIATIEASLRENPSTHIIWIDAHADANSIEESITGNFHGMPAYYLMKKPYQRPLLLQWMKKTLNPNQLTYIGLRDLDPFEVNLLNTNNIRYFTAEDVAKNGINQVLQFLFQKNKLFEKIHLSFDIDSLDPNYGLCTGVPVANGLKIADVERIFQLVQRTGKLMNIDFVEVNPLMAKSAAELDSVYALAIHLLNILSEPTHLTTKESLHATAHH